MRPRRGLLHTLLSGASLVALVACVACKPSEAKLPPKPPTTEAGTSTVAHVGDLAISSDTVLAIMRAQHVDAHAAVKLAVRDALFAAEALDRRLDVGLDRSISGVMARGLIDKSTEKARAAGPIRDDELDALTSNELKPQDPNVPYVSKYFDVNRPEAWATVHALVPVTDPAMSDRAKKVAQAIYDAEVRVSKAMTGTYAPALNDGMLAAFRHAAESVDNDGFTLRIEFIMPLAADGGSVQPDKPRQPYEPAFVKAATALQRRGDLTGPVETSFGWHVIMLVDRIPPRILSRDRLVDLFSVEVIAQRSKANLNDVLTTLRAATPVPLDRNVDAILQELHIGAPIALTADDHSTTPPSPQ